MFHNNAYLSNASTHKYDLHLLKYFFNISKITAESHAVFSVTIFNIVFESISFIAVPLQFWQPNPSYEILIICIWLWKQSKSIHTASLMHPNWNWQPFLNTDVTNLIVLSPIIFFSILLFLLFFHVICWFELI